MNNHPNLKQGTRKPYKTVTVQQLLDALLHVPEHKRNTLLISTADGIASHILLQSTHNNVPCERPEATELRVTIVSHISS